MAISDLLVMTYSEKHFKNKSAALARLVLEWESQVDKKLDTVV